jgi:lactate dehydrogenase-like 2-hydroxyacid dehydrogenase
MTKPHILQMGAYPSWDVEALKASFELHRYYEASDKNAFVAQHADKIRGIATRGELGANRDLINSLPHLEVISVYGVGYDAVDLEAARERNVRVTNTPDVLTKDVADLALAMMLAQSRAVVPGDHWVRSGKWASEGNMPLQRRVHGRKAGILGLGRIGYEVARRLAGFEMDIAYCDVAPRDFAIDWTFVSDAQALAERSDFLFVTLTGGPSTRHVVNRSVIEALGPTGSLINVSRASNVDEDALLDALESGKLGWAALDVFEGEPRLNPRFTMLPNVLLQPHQASATEETRRAMGRLVLDNLTAHFEGRTLPTPVL